MTIVLNKDLQETAVLTERNIPCISTDEAMREDIRALRIGILNVHSHDESYEANLLYPLGRSVMQIEPIWIRLRDRQYAQTDLRHLDTLYLYFDDVVERGNLDGLILAGSPVKNTPVEELPYWTEISRILEYARKSISGTLGICWGALAMAAFLGVPTRRFTRKQFGVFPAYSLDSSLGVMNVMDDEFFYPESRWFGIDESIAESEAVKGNLVKLAQSPVAGTVMAETPDHRFLMHFGHPEYETGTLIHEYQQAHAEDSNAFAPERVDLQHPLTIWRGHCNALFAQWIRNIHETI